MSTPSLPSGSYRAASLKKVWQAQLAGWLQALRRLAAPWRRPRVQA